MTLEALTADCYFVNSIMMTFRISIHCLSYYNISTFRILLIYQEAKTLLKFFSILQHYVAAGDDLAGGCRGCDTPPPPNIFVSFGKIWFIRKKSFVGSQ